MSAIVFGPILAHKQKEAISVRFPVRLQGDWINREEGRIKLDDAERKLKEAIGKQGGLPENTRLERYDDDILNVIMPCANMAETVKKTAQAKYVVSAILNIASTEIIVQGRR